jgi:putative membrane protein
LLALSAAWHVVRLHDFRLERHAGGFRIAYGLLTRRIASVPRERIQLLAVSESVLHRCMGRVSVRIETAGGAESAAEHRQWFAPLVRRGELPRLLREVHPRLDLDESLSFPAGSGVDWRPLAPGERRRMLRRAVLVSIGVAAACALAFRPWGGLVLCVVLPVAAWHAVTESRFLGFARPGYGMLLRSGAWNRAWVVTFDDRMQVVTCTESPFDRRWGMATLAVDTAGAGNSGRRVRVPYLARRTAGELRRELACSAEEAGFRWAPARGTAPIGKA